MTTDSGTGPEPGGSGVEEGLAGELPAGWVRATIGELCDVNPRGFDEEPADSELISQVPMAAVEVATGRMDASKRVRYGDLKKKSLTTFQENDVLFAKITPCMENGKIAKAQGLTGGRALGSTEFHVLRSRGAVLPEYLMHFLLQSNVRKTAERHMTGAVGQRRVPRPYLAELEIPVPPLAEQHRIVAKLGDQLAHVEAGEGAVQAALTASAVLEDLITGGGACGGLDGVECFPAPLEPADSDDGVLPDLPLGWKWGRLGEIADVVGGVTKDGKKQGDPEHVEVPYLRVANVQRGCLVLDRVEKIRVPEKKAQSLKLEFGDVLLNEGGDRDKLGRGWIWEGQIEDCIHQNHVFRARVRGQVLDPRLLAWHSNAFGKNWCDRNGRQTVNLASISLRTIKLMPVPVPPKFMQGDLVKAVESRLAEAKSAQQVIQGVREQGEGLRSGLLHAAFTGTLVLQDPDDEPASALLDRIRAQRAADTKPAKRKHAPRKTSQAAPETSGRPVPAGTQDTLPL
ncbi:restriction endonuclease subunit S [Streptomyces sp. NBC_00342]|uniref:restriction endonuclease subunit S n=1 Tax=Streptomyces sp. NBC_00342 TaxID=2975718 RepID=UPI002E2BE5B4|nr:restriction endonuclease subunit S [Streptomyces sp. NBC_00342]